MFQEDDRNVLEFAKQHGSDSKKWLLNAASPDWPFIHHTQTTLPVQNNSIHTGVHRAPQPRSTAEVHQRLMYLMRVLKRKREQAISSSRAMTPSI
jgi:hypothetical protein